MKQTEIFGAAKWLTFDGMSTPAVRADFDCGDVAEARVSVCGLGLFELYINGRKVSDDLFVPAVSDYVPDDFTWGGVPFGEELGHRIYCLDYDITGYVKQGANRLAAALGPGFFATHMPCYDTDQYYGDVCLIYRVTWTNKDGSTGEFLSGTDAKYTRSRVSESRFFQGENIDLRRLPADWTTMDAAAWTPVKLMDDPDTEFYYQDCPADRVERYIKPRLMNDFCGTKVYDCGENISGLVILRDTGSEGEVTEVFFSELTTPSGGLLQAQGHKQFFRVTGSGKGETAHPVFTWNAFRYFSVCGPMEVVSVAVVHTDVPLTSSFRCSSPALTWLYDAFVRTQYNNMHGGIPSDCPHIERRGYTGDGQLCCETVMHVMGSKSFYRKWMRDIADCQDRITGHVQYTAPFTRNGGGPGGWGGAIAFVPWKYYKYYGDAAPLAEMYDGIQHYVDFMVSVSENGLVMRDRPNAWVLGDWCAPGRMRIPAPFVNTYFLIKALDVLYAAEDVLDKPHRADRAALRESVCEAIKKAYYDEGTGSFCGGTQGADAFAIDIGMGDARTLENLVRKYEELGCYDTGIFGTEIVTRVLFEKGRAHTAVKLLDSDKPVSFAQWMKSGLTTLPEYWAGEYNRSFNHPMFGAALTQCFARILGIRQKEASAGWNDAVIAPAVTDIISDANGHITVPQGEIRVSYAAMDGHGRAEIELPAGVNAVWQGPGAEKVLSAGKNSIEW